MKVKSYSELNIWKISIDIATKIYKITTKYFPNDYGLIDQMRRASVSISSNIAEGFERNSDKEFKRYLQIAKGSLGELKTQILIANRIDKLPKDEFEKLDDELMSLSNQIGSFIKYLKTNSFKAY